MEFNPNIYKTLLTMAMGIDKAEVVELLLSKSEITINCRDI